MCTRDINIEKAFVSRLCGWWSNSRGRFHELMWLKCKIFHASFAFSLPYRFTSSAYSQHKKTRNKNTFFLHNRNVERNNAFEHSRRAHFECYNRYRSQVRLCVSFWPVQGAIGNLYSNRIPRFLHFTFIHFHLLTRSFRVVFIVEQWMVMENGVVTDRLYYVIFYHVNFFCRNTSEARERHHKISNVNWFIF